MTLIFDDMIRARTAAEEILMWDRLERRDIERRGLRQGPGEEARDETAARPDGPAPSRWTLPANGARTKLSSTASAKGTKTSRAK